MEPISLESYNPIWCVSFNQIKEYLNVFLPTYEIIHLGSSSISNLASRPIIDINIIINHLNDLPHVKDTLIKIGYFFEGNTHKECYAFKPINLKLPKHELFVCISSSPYLLKQIAFKKKLLKDSVLLNRYQNFKQDLIKKYPYNLKIYQKLKANFIDIVLENDVKVTDYQVMMPNFNNSLVNLTSSIQAYFKEKPFYSTIKSVDEALIGARNIVLLVLDGMGKAILEHHLEENCFLRRNVIQNLSSVFPPTTVASTNAILSGRLPGETGWIGWQQYFSDINRHLVLFRMTDYYTDEVVDYDISQYLSYEPFSKSFKNVNTFELYPAFKPNGFKSFKEMTEEIIRITKSSNQTYTYAYWDNPDYLIHEYGCYHEKIKTTLEMINQEIEIMVKSLGCQTCLIVTADHGLVDTIDINLNNFKDIMSCFTKKLALETRCTSFYVNDHQTFRSLFNRYFSSYFDLYDKSAFLEGNFLGSNYQKAKPFIGDFIAIAKDKYCLTAKDGDLAFQASHAGMTTNEMVIPLIIYKNY